jgi:hypothetical protein
MLTQSKSYPVTDVKVWFKCVSFVFIKHITVKPKITTSLCVTWLNSDSRLNAPILCNPFVSHSFTAFSKFDRFCLFNYMFVVRAIIVTYVASAGMVIG